MKDFFNPRLKRTITPAKQKREVIFYNPDKTRRAIFGVGSGLFLIGLIYLVYLYTPLTKEFLVYSWLTYFRSEQLDRQAETALVSPAPMEPTPTLPPNPDESFSVIIPKINAQAKVVSDVNPVERDVYQLSLKEGVAHAAGSAYPGEGDTIYLFAHSTNGQWNVVRYNAVFFLLNHLEVNDEIWMIYNKRLYPYLVVDKKIVEADEVSYLNSYHDGETLILQTCWPPGTILKRLLVFAKPKES